MKITGQSHGAHRRSLQVNINRPLTPERQLHIDKSIEVANSNLTGKIIPQPAPDQGGLHPLINCQYFTLSLMDTRKQPALLDTTGESFHALTVIRGSIRLEGTNWEQKLITFQTALIPADSGRYQLISENPCQVLCSQTGVNLLR